MVIDKIEKTIDVPIFSPRAMPASSVDVKAGG